MRINKWNVDFILSIVAIVLTSFTVFCTLAPLTEVTCPPKNDPDLEREI